jgi:formamidopyrimidine-DNA glycosylase
VPELPEVETTVRGLRPVLEGQVIRSIETRRANLRRAFPDDLRQRLTGARVTDLDRRAKYGLIGTDRGDTMIFHLGMSGRWRVDPAELQLHETLAAFPAFQLLGPEPLDRSFDAAYLRAALAGKRTSIKLALLDQRVVAGLGNIYVCEALYDARIDPHQMAGDIGHDALVRLVDAVHLVLEAAIAAGGSTLRDYARPDGELGYFSKQFAVYGREGGPCACGGLVARYAEGGRSTFWCPTCQGTKQPKRRRKS